MRPHPLGFLRRCLRLCLLLCLLLGVTAVPRAGGDVRLTHVDVFTNGDDGYHIFRIPSIVRTADGTLHAFAEGRLTNSADPGGTHIDLVYKFSTDGGGTWSPMQVLDRHPEADAQNLQSDQTSASNSVALVDRSLNRIWVFNLRLPNGLRAHHSQRHRDDMQTWARYSDDNGRTWSQPTRIAVPEHEDFYPNLGSGIQMSDGRLVVPATARAYDAELTRSFVLYSDDHGKTWNAGALLPGVGTNEAQVVELENGDLFMSARQNSGEHRVHAISDDGGETWKSVWAAVPMTRVAAALEHYRSGEAGVPDASWILFSLPEGGPLEARSRLSIRSSFDEGRSFEASRLVYHGPSAYSDMVRLEGQEVGVLWERGPLKDKSITFSVINRQFLKPEEATGLLTSESFAYTGSSLGHAIGGNGWNSGWAAAATGRAALVGASPAGLVNSSLEHPGAIGASGGAATLLGQTMARGLGVPLNLDAERTYYVSMLVRRASVRGDSSQFLDVLLLDSEGNTQAVFGNGTGGHWFLGGVGQGRATARRAAKTGMTYLLVAKLSAHDNPSGVDQMFLHAFAAGDAVPETDADLQWMLTGTENENATAAIDRLLIRGGDNAEWVVDEVRIAMDWTSVVRPSRLAPTPVAEPAR